MNKDPDLDDATQPFSQNQDVVEQQKGNATVANPRATGFKDWCQFLSDENLQHLQKILLATNPKLLPATGLPEILCFWYILTEFAKFFRMPVKLEKVAYNYEGIKRLRRNLNETVHGKWITEIQQEVESRKVQPHSIDYDKGIKMLQDLNRQKKDAVDYIVTKCIDFGQSIDDAMGIRSTFFPDWWDKASDEEAIWHAFITGQQSNDSISFSAASRITSIFSNKQTESIGNKRILDVSSSEDQTIQCEEMKKKKIVDLPIQIDSALEQVAENDDTSEISLNNNDKAGQDKKPTDDNRTDLLSQETPVEMIEDVGELEEKRCGREENRNGQNIGVDSDPNQSKNLIDEIINGKDMMDGDTEEKSTENNGNKHEKGNESIDIDDNKDELKCKSSDDDMEDEEGEGDAREDDDEDTEEDEEDSNYLISDDEINSTDSETEFDGTRIYQTRNQS